MNWQANERKKPQLTSNEGVFNYKPLCSKNWDFNSKPKPKKEKVII